MRILKYRITVFALLIFFSGTVSAQVTDTSYSEPRNVDVKLFRAVNNSRSGFTDAVIPITDKSVYPVNIAVPLGLAFVSRLSGNYYGENSGVLTGIAEIANVGITLGIKNLVKRERPYVSLRNVHFNRHNSPTDRYSFPSGHTSSSFSMATMLTLRYPDEPLVIAGSYLYAVIAGYGRIYLGMHYPSDVLGGAVTGAGSAVLVYSLRKEIIDAKNNLFNEKGRPDSRTNNFSPALFLAGFIITDAVNSLFNQGNGILKDASVSVDPANARINFIKGF